MNSAVVPPTCSCSATAQRATGPQHLDRCVGEPSAEPRRGDRGADWHTSVSRPSPGLGTAQQALTPPATQPRPLPGRTGPPVDHPIGRPRAPVARAHRQRAAPASSPSRGRPPHRTAPRAPFCTREASSPTVSLPLQRWATRPRGQHSSRRVVLNWLRQPLRGALGGSYIHGPGPGPSQAGAVVSERAIHHRRDSAAKCCARRLHEVTVRRAAGHRALPSSLPRTAVPASPRRAGAASSNWRTAAAVAGPATAALRRTP